MESYEPTTNGVEQALDVFRRRKWLAVLTFIAALTAGLAVVTFLPEVYRSSATVLIERQQIPDELVRPTVTSSLEVRLHTISQQILSRSRLEALINRFELYSELKGENPLEVIIEQMRSDIGLELRGSEQGRGTKATVAFTVSYRGRDPQQVANVTNTLASFYIEENLKVREEQAVGTAKFLRVQLEDMQKGLEEQERRLGKFKEMHIGELPHHQEANLATLEQLNARLLLNNNNQAQVTERRAALEKQASEAQGFGTSGPNNSPATLSEMKLRLAGLQRRYTDKYPDVVRLKGEIASLEQKLTDVEAGGEGSERESGLSASPHVLQLKKSISEADAELNALKVEEGRFQSTIASYQRRVENAPRREQEFQVLSRDYETTQELYRSLLVRQKEAELAENMEQRQKGEQFRILDPAAVSASPAAPDRPRLYLIVLMLALGLAAGVVILTEQFNTAFHSADELRAVSSVPILVSIPRIITDVDRRHHRLQLLIGALCAAVGLAAIVGVSYLVAKGNTQFTSLLVR